MLTETKVLLLDWPPTLELEMGNDDAVLDVELIKLELSSDDVVLDATEDMLFGLLLLDELNELTADELSVDELSLDELLDEALLSLEDEPPQPINKPSSAPISAYFMVKPESWRKDKMIVLLRNLFSCELIRNDDGIARQFC